MKLLYRAFQMVLVVSCILVIALFVFPTEVVAAQKTTKDVISDEEAMKEIISFLKEKAEKKELENAEDFETAIADGEEQLGITLSKTEKDKILKVVDNLKDMGLSSEFIISQAEKLYDQYGDQLIEQTEQAVGDLVGEAVTDIVTNASSSFWKDVKTAVGAFFKSIFNM